MGGNFGEKSFRAAMGAFGFAAERLGFQKGKSSAKRNSKKKQENLASSARPWAPAAQAPPEAKPFRKEEIFPVLLLHIS